MIITNTIQPVLGFTVKNSIFEKGKQTVCGGCLLKGIKLFWVIGRIMVQLIGGVKFF